MKNLTALLFLISALFAKCDRGEPKAETDFHCTRASTQVANGDAMFFNGEIWVAENVDTISERNKHGREWQKGYTRNPDTVNGQCGTRIENIGNPPRRTYMFTDPPEWE